MSHFLERAERLMEVRRFKNAIPHLLDHLASAPNEARAHCMLARCLLNLKQYQQAKFHIKEALHSSPDDAYAHYVHSHILDHLKRPGEARAAIQEALRLSPGTPDYLTRSADLWIAQSKYFEAIQDAERGLESDPSHVECGCNLASALISQGKALESEEVIQRMLGLHPDHALVHTTYAWVANVRGRRRIARHHFTEALRIDPEYEWALTGLRETLNDNFCWRFMEALEGNLLESPWGIFGFLCLFGAGYMGIWHGPWLFDKKPVPTREVISHVIATIGLIAFCLSQLIGKSLSHARLAMCAQGRQLMLCDELNATLIAWWFVSCASVMMTAGTIAMHRPLYLTGTIFMWGVVPATGIWKYRPMKLRLFFAILAALYFVSAILCAPGFAEQAGRLVISPWWHWLIALFVFVSAGVASRRQDEAE